MYLRKYLMITFCATYLTAGLGIFKNPELQAAQTQEKTTKKPKVIQSPKKQESTLNLKPEPKEEPDKSQELESESKPDIEPETKSTDSSKKLDPIEEKLEQMKQKLDELNEKMKECNDRIESQKITIGICAGFSILTLGTMVGVLSILYCNKDRVFDTN